MEGFFWNILLSSWVFPLLMTFNCYISFFPNVPCVRDNEVSGELSFRKWCLSATGSVLQSKYRTNSAWDSTVGHLVSQIHHWSNLEVKKCHPKFCLFSGDTGKHQFLLGIAVALKQERLAVNKSDLENRRFLIIRTVGFWSSMLEKKKKKPNYFYRRALKVNHITWRAACSIRGTNLVT